MTIILFNPADLFFKRNLTFELPNGGLKGDIGGRSRWDGLRVTHCQYRPEEIAKVLKTVRFRKSIDIGRCDSALRIVFKTLDIYFEFVVADGPHGARALYVYQLSMLYVLTWTVTDTPATEKQHTCRIPTA
jgi:hypothetical protein